MSNDAIVYPMFAMVVLTATVLVIMFRSRVRAVRENALTSAYFRVYQGGTEPDRVHNRRAISSISSRRRRSSTQRVS